MISLDPAPTPQAAEMTDQFFEPDGLLEQYCAESKTPFELRPQQQKMARAIADGQPLPQRGPGNGGGLGARGASGAY